MSVCTKRNGLALVTSWPWPPLQEMLQEVAHKNAVALAISLQNDERNA